MNQIPKGKTKFLLSITDTVQISHWFQKHDKIKSLAMVGRSNVGKSTLINSLFGKEIARTSKTPGRTRAINVFEFEINEKKRYLYDLPGYGYAKVSKSLRQQWDQLIDLYFRSLGQETLIINIEDARHPQQQADKNLHHYLRQFHLSIFLVFNKLDKIKTQKDKGILEKNKKEIRDNYKWVQEIFYISAKSKQGLNHLESSLVQFLS